MSEYCNVLNVEDLQRFLKTDRIPKKVKVLLSGNTHFLNRKGLAIIQHLLCWCGFGVCQYTVTRPALYLQYSSQLQNPGLFFT